MALHELEKLSLFAADVIPQQSSPLLERWSKSAGLLFHLLQAAPQLPMLLFEAAHQFGFGSKVAAGQREDDLLLGCKVMPEMVTVEVEDAVSLLLRSRGPAHLRRLGGALQQTLRDDESVMVIVREWNQSGMALHGHSIVTGIPSPAQLSSRLESLWHRPPADAALRLTRPDGFLPVRGRGAKVAH